MRRTGYRNLGKVDVITNPDASVDASDEYGHMRLLFLLHSNPTPVPLARHVHHPPAVFDLLDAHEGRAYLLADNVRLLESLAYDCLQDRHFNISSITVKDTAFLDCSSRYLFASNWANGASLLTPKSAQSRPSHLSRSVTSSNTSTGAAVAPSGGGSGGFATVGRGSNRLVASTRLDVPHKLVKSTSTPQFGRRGMAAVAMPSRADDDGVVDTRTPSPIRRVDSDTSSTATGTATTDAYKPDLSAEVTMLSTKLVNALNYQTNLDDALQACRHELEQSRQELTRLQKDKSEWDGLVSRGVLVRRNVVEQQITQLKTDLAKEKIAREEAEKAKKQTEGELENLTTALFEEANTMVAAARKDSEAMERRNSQLRGQLNDTELLLASQQEQLKDLKENMERMERASDSDTYGGQRDASVPTTPIHATGGSFENMLSPSSVGAVNVSPEHPLYFSQLLLPILRHDVPAYNEFQDLLLQSRRGMPHSRNNSNNVNSIASSSQTNLASGASNSSPNIPGAFSFASNASLQSNSASQAPPLKESKFYKRTLVEDLEPTLRLDTAPGLSFLSRRTVLSSLLLGTLVVEPFLPQTKFYGPLFACSLCGESRKTDPYLRRHRFRTSEEESAQRYPLCDYCLTRIRAAGDFVGFLRMVREGYWRGETEDEQNSAWEETVRLRERMFWARVGGGVVPLARRDVPDSPSTTAGIKSTRPSFEVAPPVARSPSKLATVENAEPNRPDAEETEDVGFGRKNGKDDNDDATDHDSNSQQQKLGSNRVVSTATIVRAATAGNEGEERDDEDEEGIAVTPETAPFEHATPAQASDAAPQSADVATRSEDAETAHLESAATATEPLERDASSVITSENSPSAEPALSSTSAIAGSTTPLRPQSLIEPRNPATSRPASPPKRSMDSLRLSQPANPSPERRASGVLARVRAMETKARGEQQQLPGSHD
nr:rab guanine nucleotide exchange factor sec2 [Quercus suber]